MKTAKVVDIARKPLAQASAKASGRFDSDRVLGLVGGTLAAASATFGVAMTLHGPVAGLGQSGGFTVFAQLSPRRPPAKSRAAEATEASELDDSTTASIPRRVSAGAVSTVTLQGANAESATIVVGGRRTVVRVGDMIPGVGAVLAIVPGERPMLRTTGGLIAAAVPGR